MRRSRGQPLIQDEIFGSAKTQAYLRSSSVFEYRQRLDVIGERKQRERLQTLKP